MISEYQCSVCTAGHSHTKSIGLSPVSPEKWHFLWGIPRFQISPCWSTILTSWYQQSHGRPTMLVVQWKICVKSTFIDIEERCFPRDFRSFPGIKRSLGKEIRKMIGKPLLVPLANINLVICMVNNGYLGPGNNTDTQNRQGVVGGNSINSHFKARWHNMASLQWVLWVILSSRWSFYIIFTICPPRRRIAQSHYAPTASRSWQRSTISRTTWASRAHAQTMPRPWQKVCLKLGVVWPDINIYIYITYIICI